MDGGDGSADLVINKRFVSEAELEERRKRRQEEWEKVRKPEDPEECPEEAYDPRSLYERLQEQREKKQQEFEEQFKFSKHQPLLLATKLSRLQQLNAASAGYVCMSYLSE
uniref:FAM192A/Fyv6 N-terminal domain-containing protein n=1 Tax=Coturnix japonica TaxID=93934 RepID=A0A8C2TJ32_COTJA